MSTELKILVSDVIRTLEGNGIVYYHDPNVEGLLTPLLRKWGEQRFDEGYDCGHAEGYERARENFQ